MWCQNPECDNVVAFGCKNLKCRALIRNLLLKYKIYKYKIRKKKHKLYFGIITRIARMSTEIVGH